ncbi:GH43-C2 domain-containing protein [Fusarium keratoplasticum]|nr:GH43-C2 domain-containing protein [Fusarium keratoplasticum]
MAKTTYQNPIVPGFAPDPSVLFVDGVFYLCTSSFHIFPGLPIYASRDLKEWTHIGNAFNRIEQMSLKDATTNKSTLDTGKIIVASGGLFAPSIRYHNGTFYIICTNAAITTDSFRTDNFIVTSTDPLKGEWSDPIYIPFMGIDPDLFFDDDGKVYFQGAHYFQKTQPTSVIQQFELDIKTGKHLSETKTIWGGHAKYDTEAPHIYKRGKTYYLMVAEGGTFEHHMLCIGRSDNIWGPYEDNKQNPILTADGTEEYIQNTGHGDIFQDGDDNWWAAGLAVRNENADSKDAFLAPLGRESFLSPVEWPEDGWPKAQRFKMEFSATSINPTGGAPFTAPPRVEDCYIRTPDLSKYQISEQDGGEIGLFPSTTNLDAPNGTSTFIGQRQRSLTSVATAIVDISSVQGGAEAGLTMYKDHLRHVSLVYAADSGRVSCRLRSVEDLETVGGELAVEGSKSVELRITAHPTKWSLSAQVGEGNWHEFGDVPSFRLSVREMTGPIYGVFAHAVTAQADASSAVKFVEFNVQN